MPDAASRLPLAIAAAPYAALLVALPALRARLPAALRTGELREVPRSAVAPSDADTPSSPAALWVDLVLSPFAELYRGILARPVAPPPGALAVLPEAEIQVRMYRLWTGVLRGAGPVAIGVAAAWSADVWLGMLGWIVAWLAGSWACVRGARAFARYAGMPIAEREARSDDPPVR